MTFGAGKIESLAARNHSFLPRRKAAAAEWSVHWNIAEGPGRPSKLRKRGRIAPLPKVTACDYSTTRRLAGHQIPTRLSRSVQSWPYTCVLVEADSH